MVELGEVEAWITRRDIREDPMRSPLFAVSFPPSRHLMSLGTPERYEALVPHPAHSTEDIV